MVKIHASRKIILSLLDRIGRFFFANQVTRKKNYKSKPDFLVNPKKVLFIEIWGIGDLVMMTPALKAARNLFSSAEVTLLAKSFAVDLLQSESLVDKYILFNIPWTKFKGKYRFWEWDWIGLVRVIKILRKEKFDLALDARGDFRNNLLSFLIGAKRRIGYDWSGGDYFLTDVVSADYKKMHRVEAWLNLLKYFGAEIKNLEPRISILKSEEDWAEDFLKNKGIEKGELLIGIHPGARIKTRCWPLERFAKIAEYARDTYKAKIIVFADSEGYGSQIPIKGDYTLVRLSLRQLIALLQKLNLLICNDSAPMHLAAAVGTPIVAIFGPTEPRYFGPHGDANRIIIKEGFPCRPCYDYCKYKEPFCITGISVDEVLKAMDHKLGTLPHNKKYYENIYKWK